MEASPGRKPFLGIAQPPARLAGSLYVHVPFCRVKCGYCDFCSIPYDQALAQDVVGATILELAGRAGRLELPLRTAFVGGGTPSALEPSLLGRLLRMIARFGGDATEFTVEANPNSLSPAVLAAMTSAGVNRLSLGVQSFHDAELAFLGRIHSAAEARQAVADGQGAGFGAENMSVDLIYGIPTQTLQTWRGSLQQAIDLGVGHVSSYCLTFEEATALGAALEAGRFEPMEEGLQRDCYYLAIDLLGAAGLVQYEISNFARVGHECRHNLTYWNNDAYIGVGPSAVSYVDGRRQANSATIVEYPGLIRRAGHAVESSEEITGRPLMAETLMLGLRLRAGVDRAAFAQRFGADPAEAFSQSILRYTHMGMIRLTPQRLVLEPRALFVADTILADIVAEAAQ